MGGLVLEDVGPYIPVLFKDTAGPLVDAMNRVIKSFLVEIDGIRYLYHPERVPVQCLDVLGKIFFADFQFGDTEIIKRRKLQTATQRLKFRGTWGFDVKPGIDAIVGADSRIFKSVGTADWILIGGAPEPLGHYTSTMGGDGTDPQYGLNLIGVGTELEVAGNIAIDLDSDALTAGDIDKIKEFLAGRVPIYYRIFLGFIVGDDFNVYGNGVMPDA